MNERIRKPEKEPILGKEKSLERGTSGIFDQFSRASEGNNVLGEAFSKPDKLASFYDRASKKYKEILGAAVFALAFQTGGLAIAKEDAPSLPMAKSEALEFKKILGFDVATEAAKVGRRAVASIPQNESASTIIHLDQSHNTTPERNHRNLAEISKSQSEIAQFLLAMTKPNQYVFVEGYEHKEVEYTGNFKDEVAKITKASSYDEIRSLYANMVKKYNVPRGIALLNKVAGDKLISIGFKEVSPLRYVKDSSAFMLYESDYFPSNKSYTVPNRGQALMAGGAETLFMEGRILLAPAETREGIIKPSQLADELKEKGESLRKIFTSFHPNDGPFRPLVSIPPSISQFSSLDLVLLAEEEPCKKSRECQRLTTEILQKDIPAIENAERIEREKIAVNLIASYAQKSEQKVFPLVYGRLHDFKLAVEEWNQANPGYKFNLITVK